MNRAAPSMLLRVESPEPTQLLVSFSTAPPEPPTFSSEAPPPALVLVGPSGAGKSTLIQVSGSSPHARRCREGVLEQARDVSGARGDIFFTMGNPFSPCVVTGCRAAGLGACGRVAGEWRVEARRGHEAGGITSA
jgi:hypothetical protein